MPECGSPKASRLEQQLAQRMVAPGISRAEILELLRRVPAEQKFFMRSEWVQITRNNTLEDWRRLASYQLIVDRTISYPCKFTSFDADALRPLGIREDQLIDMTMGQYVPVQRNSGSVIRMATLPFSTSVGDAALYLAVCPADNVVEQAAVYPGVHQME